MTNDDVVRAWSRYFYNFATATATTISAEPQIIPVNHECNNCSQHRRVRQKSPARSPDERPWRIRNGRNWWNWRDRVGTPVDDGVIGQHRRCERHQLEPEHSKMLFQLQFN